MRGWCRSSKLGRLRRSVVLALTAAAAYTTPAAAQQVARSEVGPYDLLLLPGRASPGASGRARLVFAPSPFGIAVTADGHAIYDVQVTAKGLPPAASLGPYSAYIAWAASIDLSQWVRLGPVANGTTTVGPVHLDKFLVVITAEASTTPDRRAGPTVLHGTSPSAWLQSFLTHPLFRGIR